MLDQTAQRGMAWREIRNLQNASRNFCINTQSWTWEVDQARNDGMINNLPGMMKWKGQCRIQMEHCLSSGWRNHTCGTNLKLSLYPARNNFEGMNMRVMCNRSGVDLCSVLSMKEWSINNVCYTGRIAFAFGLQNGCLHGFFLNRWWLSVFGKLYRFLLTQSYTGASS